MASTGKKKTTMAKLARESRLRERRLEKAARKIARKDAAAQGLAPGDDYLFDERLPDDHSPQAVAGEDAAAPDGETSLAPEPIARG